MGGLFDRMAQAAARATGRPMAFIAAMAIVFGWLGSGPFLQFNETWQLIINTITSIVTFLMVFLIQTTQNLDTQAIHLKLDELLRAQRGAHNALISSEEMDHASLDGIRAQYDRIADQARSAVRRGEMDEDSPTIKLDGK